MHSTAEVAKGIKQHSLAVTVGKVEFAIKDPYGLPYPSAIGVIRVIPF